MSALYPLALGVTLGTEMLGVGLLAHLVQRPARRVVIVCLLVNLLVHPIFWLAFDQLPGAYLSRLLVGETLVVLAEALLYRVVLDLRAAAALGLSLAVNALSTAAGLLLWQLL